MLNDLQSQLQKSLDHLRQEFSQLQTGRANAALVEDLTVHVESYGSVMELKGLANISCPDAKTIRIEPWDKAVLKDIEKAIQESSVGINPQNMGDVLVLPIPPMTEERRHDMTKIVGGLTEKARISIRNARQDILKKIKQQKDANEIGEDKANRLEKQTQEKVDETNKQVEEMHKRKEEEVMTV